MAHIETSRDNARYSAFLARQLAGSCGLVALTKCTPLRHCSLRPASMQQAQTGALPCLQQANRWTIMF